MITALFALFALSTAAFAQDPAELPPDHEDALVEYGGPDPLSIQTSAGETHEFMVEIADNDRNRARGMMFRDAVPEGTGMLFLYPADRIVSIWMKNTRVSLDLIYIEGDGRIAKIAHRHIPYSLESISSEVPVQAVLEIAGGRAAALGIRPGDTVIHPAFTGE